MKPYKPHSIRLRDIVPCYTCRHGDAPGKVSNCKCPRLTTIQQTYQLPVLAVVNEHCPYYQGNNEKMKTPKESLTAFNGIFDGCESEDINIMPLEAPGKPA